jgi:succinyl-CoA synthetase beta subunit
MNTNDSQFPANVPPHTIKKKDVLNVKHRTADVNLVTEASTLHVPGAYPIVSKPQVGMGGRGKAGDVAKVLRRINTEGRRLNND